MTDHEICRGLLPLSAAGLLDPAEERRLREHFQNCPECSALQSEFADMASALGNLHAPQPRPSMVALTEARVAAELSLQADRRQGAVLAAAAGMVAWGMTVAAWYAYRATGSGALVALEVWCISTGISILTAAALARSQRLKERSLR